MEASIVYSSRMLPAVHIDDDTFSTSTSEEDFLSQHQMSRDFLPCQQPTFKPVFNPSQQQVLSTPAQDTIEHVSSELGMYLQGNGHHQQPLVFTKVTEEQEEYAAGFVKALESIHQSSGSSTYSSSPGYSTYNQEFSYPTYATLEPKPAVFSEPTAPSQQYNFQTITSQTQPDTTMNTEAQDMEKLERKRLRNRIAASKCRRRKLEKIDNLQKTVQELRGGNLEKEREMVSLKEDIGNLNQEIKIHMGFGCQVVDINFQMSSFS